MPRFKFEYAPRRRLMPSAQPQVEKPADWYQQLETMRGEQQQLRMMQAAAQIHYHLVKEAAETAKMQLTADQQARSEKASVNIMKTMAGLDPHDPKWYAKYASALADNPAIYHNANMTEFLKGIQNPFITADAERRQHNEAVGKLAAEHGLPVNYDDNGFAKSGEVYSSVESARKEREAAQKAILEGAGGQISGGTVKTESGTIDYKNPTATGSNARLDMAREKYETNRELLKLSDQQWKESKFAQPKAELEAVNRALETIHPELTGAPTISGSKASAVSAIQGAPSTAAAPSPSLADDMLKKWTTPPQTAQP